MGDAAATSEQIREHFASAQGECAVTILAAAARVHGDLATEVAQRGGLPTVWARFGVAHGINAGDTLAAVASLALVDGAAGPPERTLAMMRVLHAAYLAASDARARAIAQGRLDALETVPDALNAVADELETLA
ncbi:MAG TPA: hypothetical protein VMD91_13035 [Candidatus Sulfotelmatobacter sp.]|nr:hypothetical protein [Candidatus Sulfotelmatobacter sp.]